MAPPPGHGHGNEEHRQDRPAVPSAFAIANRSSGFHRGGSTSLVILRTCPVPASADPVPGFDLDPAALEQRMDDCLSFHSPPDAVLMAWNNVRTAQQRTWRCNREVYTLPRADDWTGCAQAL
jgi:hypothetical protein